MCEFKKIIPQALGLPARAMAVYQPWSVTKGLDPDQLNRSEPDQKPPLGHALEQSFARAEAALEAEREKNELLQRNLDDLRRMLPAPDAPPSRRRWWPF